MQLVRNSASGSDKLYNRRNSTSYSIRDGNDYRMKGGVIAFFFSLVFALSAMPTTSYALNAWTFLQAHIADCNAYYQREGVRKQGGICRGKDEAGGTTFSGHFDSYVDRTYCAARNRTGGAWQWSDSFSNRGCVPHCRAGARSGRFHTPRNFLVTPTYFPLQEGESWTAPANKRVEVHVWAQGPKRTRLHSRHSDHFTCFKNRGTFSVNSGQRVSCTNSANGGDIMHNVRKVCIVKVRD